MEKFSVDLEKVLDEFELNEEHEEEDASSVANNQPLSHLELYQVSCTRPPAASYRRPSFEPINLSEADFASSPTRLIPISTNNDIIKNQNLNNESYFVYHGKNRGKVSLTSTYKNSVLNKPLGTNHENAWTGSVDEKPDLLEYRTKDVIIPPQLPDVTTSLWSLPDRVSSSLDEPLKSVPFCDLINSSKGNLYDNSHNSDYLQRLNDDNLHSAHTNIECNTSVNLECNINSGTNVIANNKSESYGEAIVCKEIVDEIKNDISGSLNTLHTNLEFPREELKTARAYDDFVENSIHNLPEILSNSQSDVNSFCNFQIKPDTNLEKSKDLSQKLKNELIESIRQIEAIPNKPCKTDIEIDSTGYNSSICNVLNTNDSKDCVKIMATNNNVCSLNMSVKPMGFISNEKLTDGELQQYLEELETDQEDELCNNEKNNFDKHEICLHVSHSIIKELNTYSTEDIVPKSKHSDYIDNTNNVAQTILDNKGEFISPAGSCSSSSEDKKLDKMELNDNIEMGTEINDDFDNTFNSSVDCSNQLHHQIVGKTEINNFNENLDSNKKGVEGIVNLKDSQKNDEAHIEIVANQPMEIIQKKKPLHSPEKIVRSNYIKSAEFLIENIKIDKMNNRIIPEKCNNHSVKEYEILIAANDVKPETKNQNIIKNDGTYNSCAYQIIETAKEDDKDKNNFQQTMSKIYLVNEITDADTINKPESKESHKAIKAVEESVNFENYDGCIQNASNIDCVSILSQESLEEELLDKSSNMDSALDTLSVSSSSEYDSVCNTLPKMIPVVTAGECTDKDQHSIDETAISLEEEKEKGEEEKPSRPNFLDLPACITLNIPSDNTGEVQESPDDRRLGKVAPIWVPDSEAPVCMQCQVRFNVIKRRHHCRACGQVLCSKCCYLKSRLEFCGDTEVRVCQPCFSVLESVIASDLQSPVRRQPNPNNPMEYCSTIPPLQQAAGSLHQPPPSVLVPVGVLKREGRSKSDVIKQVMFSDGIRPGGDLTELDGPSESRIPNKRPGHQIKHIGTPPGGAVTINNRKPLDPVTQSLIPQDGETSLPPIISCNQGGLVYSDCEQPITLNDGVLKFAINSNLNVLVKRIMLDCCVNRECWCYSSNGLSCVGQDEVVFLLQCLPDETLPPKDVFLLINYLYQNAAKGSTVSEMSFTPSPSTKLLGSRDHGGFLFMRPSYQCTAQLTLPSAPYLFALLVHRWEMPWARLFPIRLILRLGAEFRYYPCPLVSVRFRLPLYTDIGHTIISLLADFRKYTYTLPTVRGLVIHMEDRQTSILIPRNRYNQVLRALNNSNDSVLAFGANFSLAADSHLVCIQSIEDESLAYHTQAINIHNKPRRVTGASFVVFNGALKTPGLSGKSNIVEDGLMVQVPSETMIALRSALKDMENYTIGCGPNAEETVHLQWTVDDTNFNVGVKSWIDGRPLNGIPSIRVHNGKDYNGSSKLIRWTEVFILQSEEDIDRSREPIDVNRLAGSIAQATCIALVPLLDLLSAASFTCIAVRADIHPDNVGYEAGGNGEKLPPFYMKSLDNELVAVIHQAALTAENSSVTLELLFRIMEQG